MRWSVRSALLLVAILILASAAAPPLIEDHLEAGFCSADCSVQHDGQATAVEPTPSPGETRHIAARHAGGIGVTDASPGATFGPSSPRAPPST